MKLGSFCTLYTHFVLYAKMGRVIKVLNLRRQILAPNTEIVMTEGVDSSSKAIYCVRPDSQLSVRTPWTVLTPERQGLG